MTRALSLSGSCALRLPPLQQPAPRRPILRLVGGRDERRPDFPPLRLPLPQAAPRPAAPAAPPAVDEDFERWDGLS